MKQSIIKLIKILLLPPGLFFSCFRKRDPFVILMYHRVQNNVEKELAVREEDFRWQMRYLQKKGYHVLSLDEALQMPRAQRRRGRNVVLTFDDGYADYYTTAYPILASYLYPSLVYVVPGFVETGRTFWWDEDTGESPLMSWEQMREIHKDGLTQFGSHTMTHPDFDQIDDTQARDELTRSKAEIEKKLGHTPRHFAYPRGIVGHMDEVAAQYQTAAAIFYGYAGTQAKKPGYLMRLQRVPVQRSDGKLLFTARLNGWLLIEGWLKKLMGRR